MSETIFGTSLDYDYENFNEITLPTIKKDGREYGEIIFMGDFHYGHKQFSDSHLHKYLSMLQHQKHIQICLMGDLFEMQNLSDFVKEAEMPEAKQLEAFIRDFKPLANRILTVVWGNHEKRFAKYGMQTIDLWDYSKTKLGNSNIYSVEPGRGILSAVHAGKQIYSVYMLHSSTRAQVLMDTQLRRSRGIWAVTLITHGHTHKISWSPQTLFTVAKHDKEFCRAVVRQYLLSTGCFLRYPAYAEEKSLPVNDIGAPIVRFYADSNDIEFIDPRVRFKDFLLRGGIAYVHGDVDVSDLEKQCEYKRELGASSFDEEMKEWVRNRK